MAKGGKLAEFIVTLTDEDGYEEDVIVMAKSEDDALYKAEKIKGHESSASSVVMLTDFDGNKIEFASGGYMADGGSVKYKKGQNYLINKNGEEKRIILMKNVEEGRFVHFVILDEKGNRIYNEPTLMDYDKFEKSIVKKLPSGGYMAKGGKVGKFKVGQSVIITSDNDNYDDYRGKELVITHKATNTREHQGFDSSMEGQGLYDLIVKKTKEEVPFSLYDYEIEHFEKGGHMAKGGMIDYSKDGYVKAIRGVDGKMVKEVMVNDVLYRYNPVYKTYNSVTGNELLHKNDYDGASGGHMEKGGYNRSWYQERAQYNKSERWERPLNQRKSSYADGGTTNRVTYPDLSKIKPNVID